MNDNTEQVNPDGVGKQPALQSAEYLQFARDICAETFEQKIEVISQIQDQQSYSTKLLGKTDDILLELISSLTKRVEQLEAAAK